MQKINKSSLKNAAFKIIMVIISMTITGAALSLKLNTDDMWMSQIVAITIYTLICELILLFCLLIDKSVEGHDFDTVKTWFYFLILYSVSLLLTVGFTYIDVDYRPVSIIPMAFSLVFGLRFGFLTDIMFSSVLVLIGGETLENLLLYILLGAIASIAARFFIKIKYIIYGIIIMLIAGLAINMSFYYMLYAEIYWPAVLSSLIGIIFELIALTVFALLYKPSRKILIWNTKKKEKLQSLCSQESPAYKYMQNTSIPILTHSLDVMELAVIGAKTIGADEITVKAGALYHDIGKCESKDYIKVGISIAKKFKMPESVIKIIKEHNVSVKLPTTREAAIVMLADSVYSAYDFLSEKNTDKKPAFSSLIKTVFSSRMDKGTLNDSGLTLNEYIKIRQAFTDWTAGK